MQRVGPIILCLLLIAGCQSQQEADDSTVVRIGSLQLGRVMVPFAAALERVLPLHFPARVEVVQSNRLAGQPTLIEDGSVELAMAPTDWAYLAYTRGLPELPRPHRRLRGVGVLYTMPLHFLVKEDSGINALSDLRNKRVWIGGNGSSSQSTIKMILDAVGLSTDEIAVQEPQPGSTVAQRFQRGELDAALVFNNDPAPAIQDILAVPGIRLIPISKADVHNVQSQRLFLHSAVIFANTYGTHSAIDTVGVDIVMLCRDDLPEDLVYWITRTLFESLPELTSSFNPLRGIDLENVHASPIPLHPGAARFYRERELFQ